MKCVIKCLHSPPTTTLCFSPEYHRKASSSIKTFFIKYEGFYSLEAHEFTLFFADHPSPADYPMTLILIDYSFSHMQLLIFSYPLVLMRCWAFDSTSYSCFRECLALLRIYLASTSGMQMHLCSQRHILLVGDYVCYAVVLLLLSADPAGFFFLQCMCLVHPLYRFWETITRIVAVIV